MSMAHFCIYSIATTSDTNAVYQLNQIRFYYSGRLKFYYSGKRVPLEIFLFLSDLLLVIKMYEVSLTQGMMEKSTKVSKKFAFYNHKKAEKKFVLISFMGGLTIWLFVVIVKHQPTFVTIKMTTQRFK